MTVFKETTLRPPINEFGKKVMGHVRYCICRNCGTGWSRTAEQTECPSCGHKEAELVPGVTTVTDQLDKPALKRWANRLGLAGIDVDSYVDEAAETGTLAHYLIQASVSGLEPQLEDFTPAQLERAGHAMREFDRWREGKAIRTVLVEQQLVSTRFKYGGTVDWLVRIDDDLTLVDWKTSSGIYPEYYTQASAYVMLLREHGHRVKGARVIQIPRRPNEPLVEHVLTGEQVLANWAIYRHLLEVYFLRRDLRRATSGQRN